MKQSEVVNDGTRTRDRLTPVAAQPMVLRLCSFGLVLLSLTISLEIYSFFFLRYAADSGWQPDYLAQPRDRWLTEREAWGAWHVSSHSSRQEGRCFSVALRSNSYGARDREREMTGDPHRTIVLGDSFAEGWGVEEHQRLSNLLETRLNREFLNFATENDFGPLQYQIIYEHLASRFSHDRVLILFLPDNDFTDNDVDYWSRFREDYAERYRPYYQASGAEGYRPFYPLPKPTDDSADGRAVSSGGWTADAARLLRRNSSSLAMYRFARMILYRGLSYSGYFDFTDDQLQAVLWSFRKIKALAGDRSVTIVVIPRQSDFRRVEKSGDNPLMAKLNRFGLENEIEIADLLSLMPRLEPRTERYYLRCDGHWSAEGNAVAAQAALSAMRPRQSVTGAMDKPSGLRARFGSQAELSMRADTR
jgi:hypothetical protein